jgi:small redox-active disulfide protein 2
LEAEREAVRQVRSNARALVLTWRRFHVRILGHLTSTQPKESKSMTKQIQVFGTGCRQCERLAENVRLAAEKCGEDYSLEKVSDIAEIVRRDILSTPALAVNGRILCSGCVPSVEEIVRMLS